MKPCIFTGSAVAIVTPFRAGSIDFNAFDRLVERQIQGGTDAIVVCGTTGEAATLNYDERMALIERCVRIVDRRVPVIAGSGTNNTASSVALSKATQSAGVDALLTVTPYYNKASQNGLVRHFSAIADAVEIPLILYNVPSRTGISCTAETYQKLAEHPNIAGVKEASDDFDLIQETLNRCPPDFTLWSGNDSSTTAIMALGGKGIISVAANIVPREMHELTQLCLENRFSEAGVLQRRLHALIRALFARSTPFPSKPQWKCSTCAAASCGCRCARSPSTIYRSSHAQWRIGVSPCKRHSFNIHLHSLPHSRDIHRIHLSLFLCAFGQKEGSAPKPRRAFCKITCLRFVISPTYTFTRW